MTADATGRQVVVGPYEATAIGNALVQAMALGQVQDLRHLRAIVAASSDLEQLQPQNGAVWNEAAARYAAITAHTQ